MQIEKRGKAPPPLKDYLLFSQQPQPSLQPQLLPQPQPLPPQALPPLPPQQHRMRIRMMIHQHPPKPLLPQHIFSHLTKNSGNGYRLGRRCQRRRSRHPSRFWVILCQGGLIGYALFLKE